jgi:hypothetical protein
MGLSGASAQAQAVREVRLGKPSQVLPNGFNRIGGAVELSDGRVLVSDRGDERVVVANMETGVTSPVSRSGSGPGEYRFPDRLLQWAGDSTLLVDEGNSRLAVVGPDLRIHRTFTLQVAGVPAALIPRSVDPQGRMLAQVPRWAASGFGKHGDSVPIVRVAGTNTQAEVVAWVRLTAEPPGGIKRGLPYVPFSPQDVWAATGSGEIVVARSGDYHVEWLTAKGLVRGPAIPYHALAVTMKDRIAYTRNFLEHSSIGGRGGANQTPTGLSALPSEMLTDAAVEQLAGDNPFASERPAFTDALPLLSRDGAFWVERSVPEGAERVWDVFDGRGNPTFRVVAPVGRRLVALGRGAVYALTEDADGFEHLERYAVALR